jgi:hypothetical protein
MKIQYKLAGINKLMPSVLFPFLSMRTPTNRTIADVIREITNGKIILTLGLLFPISGSLPLKNREKSTGTIKLVADISIPLKMFNNFFTPLRHS